jgi:MFS family permease
MTMLWSAVAPAWGATPDHVAVATGAGFGLISAAGCVTGGWVVDRMGRWWVYFGAQVLMAGVAVGMAAAPRTPQIYTAGLLCYAFATGAGYAAFSAVLLHAIGQGAAATKGGILRSLGNVPVSYMTAVDGWAHDRWGAGGMLYTDALLGVAAIPVALVVLWRIRIAAARRDRTPLTIAVG